MLQGLKNIHLNIDAFVSLVDNMYDEIMIWDADYKVVYVNKASYRHYGTSPEEILGRSFYELTEKHNFWSPSTLPYVYKEKKPITQKQKTNLGANITTISMPIFNESGGIKYVIQCARDDNASLGVLLGSDKEKKRLYKICDKYKLIYKSKLMEDIVNISKKIASIKSPCLILGETGTGKTLLAKYMHECSNRRDKPFVNINCAGISPNLIESELFGYKKGAFSGAHPEGKKGLIEVANGGTLFLDEIAEIPYSLQAKFLQVIQDEEFLPIGGIRPIRVDVKIITATNRNINQMIETGNFREDLYHRLNTFELLIPPLRERKEDILVLGYYFLNQFNSKYGKKQMLSESALEVIGNYSWPGNIRELSHVMELLSVTVDDEIIESYHLPKKMFEFNKVDQGMSDNYKTLDEIQALIEEKLTKEAYQKCKTTRKMAKELGISQSKACRLVQKYIRKR